jgi:hypothetical protein
LDLLEKLSRDGTKKQDVQRLLPFTVALVAKSGEEVAREISCKETTPLGLLAPEKNLMEADICSLLLRSRNQKMTGNPEGWDGVFRREIFCAVVFCKKNYNTCFLG